MKSPQELAIREMRERDNLLQRLQDAGIGVRHTRLYGTQIRADVRLGWEPYTTERAQLLLRYLEPPSKLDIAHMRMCDDDTT